MHHSILANRGSLMFILMVLAGSAQCSFCANPTAESFRPTSEGDQSLTGGRSGGEQDPSRAAALEKISLSGNIRQAGHYGGKHHQSHKAICDERCGFAKGYPGGLAPNDREWLGSSGNVERTGCACGSQDHKRSRRQSS